MKLCSEGHGEVCFEGNACPACYDIDKVNEQLSAMEDERDKLKKEVEELETLEYLRQ